MKNICVLAACTPLILSTFATAQRPTLSCYTDVGVYAKNGLPAVKFIPRSTVITAATKLRVWTTGTATSATLTMTPAIARETATFVIREQALKSGGQGSTSAGTATATAEKPHAWLLRVPARAAGNVLLVSMQQAPSSRPFGIVQRAQIDIGNDNTLEVDQDLTVGSVRQTFALGNGAVDIRIVTESSLSNHWVSEYDFELGLTLNPDAPLKIAAYGRMCGMKLSMSGRISGSGHILSGRIEGGFFGRGAMLLLGVQPAMIPFPGTPCNVLVHPLTSLTYGDFNGTTVFDIPVPGRIDGQFYLQAVSAHTAFGLTSLRMSNGLLVDGN